MMMPPPRTGVKINEVLLTCSQAPSEELATFSQDVIHPLPGGN